jgi:hypothetical protein
LSQQTSAGGSKPTRTYKAGDTVTYVAQFAQDVPDDFAVTAFFERQGPADDSGLQGEIILSTSKRVGARQVEVSGTAGHVANGKYKLERVDLRIAGVTKMNTNPDPDGDSAFLITDSTGPSFPALTDFDPK